MSVVGEAPPPAAATIASAEVYCCEEVPSEGNINPIDLDSVANSMPRSESTRILLIASSGSMSGLLLKWKPSLCVWSLSFPIF